MAGTGESILDQELKMESKETGPGQPGEGLPDPELGSSPDPDDVDTEEVDHEIGVPSADVLPPDPQLLRDIAARCGWSTLAEPGGRRPLAAPLYLARDDQRWSPDGDANESDLQHLVQLEALVVAGVLVGEWSAWERFTSGYNAQLKDLPPPTDEAMRVAERCAAFPPIHPCIFEVVPRAVRARLTDWLRSEPEADGVQAQLQQIGEIRERVLLRNLRLAVRVGYDVYHQGLGHDDILLHGLAGVSRAIDSYEPDGPANFSTYARQWIQARVTRAASETGGPLRTPGGVAERRMRLARAIRSAVLEGQAVVAPAGATSEWYPPTRVADDEALLALLVPSDDLEPERCARLWDALERGLGALGPKKREVIELRNGLRGGAPWKLAQIGEAYGKSRERIRQIEEQAEEELWASIQADLSLVPAERGR